MKRFYVYASLVFVIVMGIKLGSVISENSPTSMVAYFGIVLGFLVINFIHELKEYYNG